jgi:beta-galactosidase
LDGALKTEADTDRATFKHLKYPPFMVNLSDLPLNPWGDLRIEGYLGGKKVISKNYSGKGIDAQLLIEPDDLQLLGDGRDMTRVVLRAADEYDNTQQFSSGAVQLTIEGPGEIVGENPFGLVAGAGAIWIRTKQSAGIVTLTAQHQYLGRKEIKIAVEASAPEAI